MVGAGAIKAGRAFVELLADDSNLRKGLRRASMKLKTFGASVTKIGGVAAGVGASIAGAFLPAIKAAGRLEATTGKFATVFGDAAAETKAWADQFRADIGRSENEVLGFLSSTQDLLVPIGIDPTAARQMSKDITALAYDIASFNDVGDAKAMDDIQAALTGSGEVMKKYGVVLNETAVKQQLLSEGLDPKTATEAQKAMARLAIIVDKTSAAHGDAKRTANEYSNSMKRMWASVEDTQASLGTALLPMVKAVISAVTDGVKWVGEFAKSSGDLIQKIAGAAAVVAAVGAAFVAFGGAVSTVGAAIGVLGPIAGALLGPAGLVAGGVALVGGLITKFVGWERSVTVIGGKIRELADGAMGLFEVATHKAKQGWEKFENSATGSKIVATSKSIAQSFYKVWEKALTAIIKKMEGLQDAMTEDWFIPLFAKMYGLDEKEVQATFSEMKEIDANSGNTDLEQEFKGIANSADAPPKPKPTAATEAAAPEVPATKPNRKRFKMPSFVGDARDALAEFETAMDGRSPDQAFGDWMGKKMNQIAPGWNARRDQAMVRFNSKTSSSVLAGRQIGSDRTPEKQLQVLKSIDEKVGKQKNYGLPVTT